MSDTENRDLSEEVEGAAEEGTQQAEKAEKLNLTVAITKQGACQRHVTVTVAREDIDRYFDKDFSELMPDAKIPGFRPGHAPRKLVENRFRKEVAERVKSALLVDSIAQVTDDEGLTAISEPDFDVDAVRLPDEGPMTFEFDIEVRPEFDLPKWKGLMIEKPVREFSKADIDAALQNLLARRGRLVPYDGPAAAGDYITANLVFKHGDEVVNQAREETIRIRPVLSFRDGKIDGFDRLMEGVRAGETRQGEALLSQEAPNAALRGQKITAIFEVLEVKRLELPELTPEFLKELGKFDSEGDLRDAIKEMLVRRLEYQQRQRAREQITNALTVAADWELPPELLRRQSARETQRAVLELQRSGFSEEEIRAHENELRQNSQATTARALKEHFILERSAEAEEVEPTEDDYDTEIRLIAMQTQQSSRRVRARLEKEGAMDALRNQIVERIVVEKILKEAEFKEVPYQPEGQEAEAVDQAAGGGEETSEIPEAKPESGVKTELKHERGAGSSD